MLPIEFQQKWIGVTLKERSASQEHFIDLCHVHPIWLAKAHATVNRAANQSNDGNG